MATPTVRLLRFVAGGQRFCLPLDAVTGIETLASAQGPQSAVQCPSTDHWPLTSDQSSARQVVHAKSASASIALAVESTAGARHAAVLPLTPVADATGGRAPFAGLAVFDDGPALALDLEALVRPAAALPAGEAWRVKEGEPVLVCRAGHVSLRGRAVGVGLPLSSVLTVCDVPSVVTLPFCLPPIAGVSAFGERAVPLLDLAAALGLPPLERHRRMVVVRGAHGPVGLLVEAADRIDRTMHWAAPDCLAPLSSHALVGAILDPSCWVAVLAPERLLAVPAAAHPAA